jgi:hypothetical protein
MITFAIFSDIYRYFRPAVLFDGMMELRHNDIIECSIPCVKVNFYYFIEINDKYERSPSA